MRSATGAAAGRQRPRATQPRASSVQPPGTIAVIVGGDELRQEPLGDRLQGYIEARREILWRVVIVHVRERRHRLNLHICERVKARYERVRVVEQPLCCWQPALVVCVHSRNLTGCVGA